MHNLRFSAHLGISIQQFFKCDIQKLALKYVDGNIFVPRSSILLYHNCLGFFSDLLGYFYM